LDGCQPGVSSVTRTPQMPSGSAGDGGLLLGCRSGDWDRREQCETGNAACLARNTPPQQPGCDLHLCCRGLLFLDLQGVSPSDESPKFNRQLLITHPELADLIGQLKLCDRLTVRADSALGVTRSPQRQLRYVIIPRCGQRTRSRRSALLDGSGEVALAPLRTGYPAHCRLKTGLDDLLSCR
jgi:hypothetical protein